MFITHIQTHRGDIQTPAFVLGRGAQVREKPPLGILQDTTVIKKVFLEESFLYIRIKRH